MKMPSLGNQKYFSDLQHAFYRWEYNVCKVCTITFQSFLSLTALCINATAVLIIDKTLFY